MQPNEQKEVRFDKYCETCTHKDVKVEYDNVCDKCLSEPTNLHSEKPVNWEKK